MPNVKDTFCSFCGTAYPPPLAYPRTCPGCQTPVWSNPIPVSVVLTPVKHRALNEGFGVTTREQRQREDWEAMRGTLLHAAREAMPETDEEEGEVYVADLIGMSVVHVDGRVLGQVKAAHDFGAGDLIEVQPAVGASFLLPFTEEVFPEIDMEARVLRADPDESYLPDSPSDSAP